MTIKHLSRVRQATRYPSYLFWSMQDGEYKKADWWCRTPNYSNTTFMGNVTLVLKV